MEVCFKFLNKTHKCPLFVKIVNNILQLNGPVTVPNHNARQNESSSPKYHNFIYEHMHQFRTVLQRNRLLLKRNQLVVLTNKFVIIINKLIWHLNLPGFQS